jgi:hypothetical protein
MAGYYWPAPNAKAVVILVHGQGSYLIFDYLKNQVGALQCAVCAPWVLLRCCVARAIMSAVTRVIHRRTRARKRWTTPCHCSCWCCCRNDTPPPPRTTPQGVGKKKTYAGSWVQALNDAGVRVLACVSPHC